MKGSTNGAPAYQVAAQLVHEGKSYKQIARIMRSTVKAVSALIGYARRQGYLSKEGKLISAKPAQPKAMLALDEHVLPSAQEVVHEEGEGEGEQGVMSANGNARMIISTPVGTFEISQNATVVMLDEALQISWGKE